ncbi:hypothetical protein ASE12_11040 [Aeromicrobium sp. Root236]|uniref:carboxypeptidase-like regulatory domain-containing protein n=1 Tax=Aeromicrobium sp. Root236 TaxID=1736498 RepID=UPI0006F7A33E|nr:carboxypeptidase-like regulatory domain-containing protein [Aeromicrobium sp. Root236]KRC65250.1 hypothetical protein ASE12_11040 [Aeromicrobium sp. Root236]
MKISGRWSAVPPVVLVASAVLTATVLSGPAQAATTPTISGTVTNQQGERLSDIVVLGERYDSTDHRWQVEDRTSTNANGQYSLTSRAGTYRLFFHDMQSAVYAQRWYPNAGWSGGATSITVTRYSVPRRNVVMPVGATISGTVSPRQAGLVVEADSHPWNVVPDGEDDPHFDVTDDDGHYTITGLPAGTQHVKVEARDPARGPDDTAQFWYGQSAYYEKSTPVSTPIGKTVTGIDITAPVAKHITGRLRLPSRVSPRRAIVFVWDRYDNLVEQVNTELDGTWKAPVAAGYYKIQYGVDYGASFEQKWHGGTSFGTASSVVLSPTATSATVNDSMHF